MWFGPAIGVLHQVRRVGLVILVEFQLWRNWNIFQSSRDEDTNYLSKELSKLYKLYGLGENWSIFQFLYNGIDCTWEFAIFKIIETRYNIYIFVGALLVRLIRAFSFLGA